jgi:hypothetical protein
VDALELLRVFLLIDKANRRFAALDRVLDPLCQRNWAELRLVMALIHPYATITSAAVS